MVGVGDGTAWYGGLRYGVDAHGQYKQHCTLTASCLHPTVRKQTHTHYLYPDSTDGVVLSVLITSDQVPLRELHRFLALANALAPKPGKTKKLDQINSSAPFRSIDVFLW